MCGGVGVGVKWGERDLAAWRVEGGGGGKGVRGAGHMEEGGGGPAAQSLKGCKVAGHVVRPA